MFGITLTDISKADVHRQLTVLLPNSVRRAEVSGINRSLTGSRQVISKTIRRDLALKAGTIKDSMVFSKARYSQPRPEATISIERKPLPLKDYSASQVRDGLSYRIKKSGGRKRIKSGFIVDAYRKNAFLRVGRARGPLKLLTGPSVGGAANQRGDDIKVNIMALVDKNIRSRVDWEVTKLLR